MSSVITSPCLLTLPARRQAGTTVNRWDCTVFRGSAASRAKVNARLQVAVTQRPVLGTMVTHLSIWLSQ
jgi:hypothetical protein